MTKNKFLPSFLALLLLISSPALAAKKDGLNEAMMGENLSGGFGDFAIQRKNIFTTANNEVLWFASFKGFMGAPNAKLRAEWIAPAGETFKSEDFTTKYGNSRFGWAKLDIKGADKAALGLEGDWTVKIYWDNELIDTQEFHLGERKFKQVSPQVVPEASPKITVEMTPRVTPQATTSSQSLGEFKRLLVVQPLIICEDAYNEQKIPSNPTLDDILLKENDKAIQEAIVNADSGEIAVLANDSEFIQTYEQMKLESEDLVKEWKNKTAQIPKFNMLAERTNADLILVQFVKAKVGVAGSWDFVLTGQTAPGTSTLTGKAVLIEPKSGKVKWFKSVIIRAVPNQNSLRDLFKSLYQEFPKKGSIT